MIYSSSNVKGTWIYAAFAELSYKGTLSVGGTFIDELTQEDDISGKGMVASYFQDDFAAYLNDRYTVVYEKDDPETGFYGVLLRETGTDNYVLSLRGTEFENDTFNDLAITDVQIGTHGFALHQAVNMQQMLDEMRDLPELQGDYKLVTTGHSLGGQLAQTALALAPDMVDEVYSFNGPGFNFDGMPLETFLGTIVLTTLLGRYYHAGDPTLGELLSQASNGLQGQVGSYIEDPIAWVNTYTDHYFTGPILDQVGVPLTQGFLDDFKTTLHFVMGRADTYQALLESRSDAVFLYEITGDIVSELVPDLLSTPQIIYSEAEDDGIVEPLSAGPHSMDAFAAAFMVHEIFYSADDQLLARDISGILTSSSNIGDEPNPSLELVVKQLSDLFEGGIYDGTIANREDLANIESTRNQFQTAALRLMTTLSSQYGGSASIISLAGLSASILESQASSGNSANSKGIRYALVNLHPFALTSDIVGTAADDSRYDIENFSQQYLSDRAQFLVNILSRNAQDIDSSESMDTNASEDIYFLDESTDERIFIGDIRAGEVGKDAKRIIFGTEGDDRSSNGSFVGGSNSDQLYGFGGDDVLIGLGGDDYLEGGSGDDRISGGAGNNTIHTGTGRDVVTIESESGTQNTVTDIGGADNYGVDGSGSVLIDDAQGSDAYSVDNFSGTLTIRDGDLDATDRLVIDGVASTISFIADGTLPNIWQSADGALDLALNGTELTITTADNGQVIIENYVDGDFGINLYITQPEPSIPPPPDLATEHTVVVIDTTPIDTLEYRVQQGDSVSIVMQRMGLNYSDTTNRDSFLATNRIENASVIFAGQLLVNPFHVDFSSDPEPQPVTPAPLATELVAAGVQAELSGDQALSGQRDAEESFNAGFGSYSIDVERRTFSGGLDTLDVDANIGSGNHFSYAESFFSDGQQTADINLTIGDDHFIVDEKAYSNGEVLRDVDLVIDDNSLSVDEQMHTNGKIARDVNLSIGQDSLSIDQTIHIDGRKTTDVDLTVDGDYLQIDESVYAQNSELTRDIELKVNENFLSIDEKVYVNGQKARDVELRVGEDYLAINEEIFSNGAETRDVELKLNESSLVYDEDIDSQGRRTTDFRLDVDDNKLHIDEEIGGDGSSIEKDILFKVGEDSLVIDEEIDAQGIETDFIRLEVGEDHLEIDENLQANGAVTTDFDLKVGEYQIDLDTVIDANNNEANDTLIRAGENSLRIDEEFDATSRKTTDTHLEVSTSSLTIDQSFEGVAGSEQLTTDISISADRGSLVVDQDIDSNGNETYYTKLTAGDDSLEVDENIEANGVKTTDVELQIGDNRFDIEQDISAAGAATDSLQLVIDDKRFERVDHIADNGTVVTDLDLQVGSTGIDIDNAIDINNNATRDITVNKGADRFVIDESVSTQGQRTTDVAIDIGEHSLSINESIGGDGSVVADLSLANDDVIFRYIENVSALGTATNYVRLSVGTDHLEIDENIEADGSVTSDVDVQIGDHRLERTLDVDAQGNSVERHTLTTSANSLMLGREIVGGANPGNATDVQLNIADNSLSVDETVESDGSISADISLQVGTAIGSIDENADGTIDYGVIVGSDTLVVDNNINGTTDTTLVYGDGAISIDENADGTSDKTISYSDALVFFDETIDGNSVITRTVNITSGASTISVASDNTVSANIDANDTHITQDAGGNIAIVLANTQGTITVSNLGIVGLTLQNNGNTIQINEVGQFNASLNHNGNSLVFNEQGAFTANLVNGANQATLDSQGNFTLSATDSGSSVAFDSSGTLDITLAKDLHQIDFSNSTGLLDVNLNQAGNTVQFTNQGQFDIALTDGSNSIDFDDTGSLDATLSKNGNTLNFNELGNFDVNLTDGSSTLSFDDQGTYAANLVEGASSISFDSTGNAQATLSDGTSSITANNQGNFDVQLSNGQSAINFDDTGAYDVLLTNGTDSFSFNQLGDISASTVINQTTLTYDRDTAGQQFSIAEGENALTIAKTDTATDLTLTKGASSIGVTTSGSDSNFTLNHETKTLDIARDAQGVGVTLTDNVTNDSISIARDNSGTSSLNLNHDGNNLSITDSEIATDASLTYNDVSLGFNQDAAQTVFSATEGSGANQNSITITNDGDGLDYQLTKADASFDWQNDGGNTIVTLAEGANSLSFDALGSITAQRDDTSLTVSGTEDAVEAVLTKDGNSLAISDDGNGLDFSVSANGNSLALENEGAITQIVADNGDQTLVIRDDNDGVDVSVQDGSIEIGIENEGEDSTVYLDINGFRVDKDFNPENLNPINIASRFGSAIGNILGGVENAFGSIGGSVFDTIGEVLGDLVEGDFNLGNLFDVAESVLDRTLNYVGEHQERLANTLAEQLSAQLELDGGEGAFVELVAAGILQEVFSYGTDGKIDFELLNNSIGEIAIGFVELGIDVLSDEFAERIVEELGVESELAQEIFGQYIDEVLSVVVNGEIDFTQINENFLPESAGKFSEYLSDVATKAILGGLGLSESSASNVAPLVDGFITQYTDELVEFVTGKDIERDEVNLYNIAGALIIGELADRIGLEGGIADATVIVGGEVLGQVISNVVEGLEWSQGIELSEIGAASVNFIAAYIGTEIGKAVYDVKTKEGVIGGAIGAIAGAKIGAELGTSLWPGVGTLIGAVVGYVFGAVFGDFIGKQSTPRTGGDLIYNHNTEEFEVLNIWAKNGGSTSEMYQIMNAAKESQDAILLAFGGDVLNKGVVYGGSFYMRLGRLVYTPIDGRESKTFNSVKSLISYSVIDSVSSLNVAGGNIYIKRAIYRAFDQYIDSGDMPSNALEQAVGLITIAGDYQNYLDNSQEINSLIQSSPNSAFSAGWIATLEQAQDLGLARRYSSDHIGGWEYLVKSEAVTIDTVSGAKEITPNYADVTLDFNNNGRVIDILRSDGNHVVVSDYVERSTKTQVQLISRQALDNLVASKLAELEQNEFVDIQVIADQLANKRIQERLDELNRVLIEEYEQLNNGADEEGEGSGEIIPLILVEFLPPEEEAQIRTQALSDTRDKLVPPNFFKSGDTILVADGQGLVDADKEIYSSAIIQGTDGADVLSSGDLGNDVFGGLGNDTLTGGANADWIFGGEGNDTLTAGAGNNNVLFGESGNDSLIGGTGSDWLKGGSGSDELRGADGNDILDGGTGNDSLVGEGGDDVYIFNRGDGQDILSDREFSFDDQSVYNLPLNQDFDFTGHFVWSNGAFGGSIGGGTDAIEFGQGIGLEHLNVRLDEASDTLIITLLNDIGQETTDTISIPDWSNIFRRIEIIRFSDGQEIQLGNFQSFIIGTNLDDVLTGTNGADFIHGGPGDDNISALAGDDVAVGGLGNDMVSGDEDDDLVVGGDGNDNLYGNDGNDIVSGDAGNDVLVGGAGNDVLSGGKGNDVLITGSGDDLVLFGHGDGHDVLSDAVGQELTQVASWDGSTNSLSFSDGYSWDGSNGTEAVYDYINSRVGDGYVWTQNGSDWALHALGAIGPDSVIDLGNDTLEFKLGVILQDIRIQQDGNDLVIGVEENGVLEQEFSEIEDTVRIKDWFGSAGASIESFRIFGMQDIDVSSFMGWQSGDSDAGTYTGTSGRDWITSAGGQDTIDSGAGDDIVDAGAGNDIVIGGSGADILFGGQGFDTLSYDTSASGIAVNLTAMSGSAGDAAGDKVEGFEYVIGSDFDDVIIGDIQNNEFIAGRGNDRVVGGEGDDVYIFSRGDGLLKASEIDNTAGIEGGGEDIIQFGENINPGDLDFIRVGLGLSISLNGTSDQIILENWFLGVDERIETLLFTDGGEIDIRNHLFELAVNDGPNWIGGDDSNNTIDGLAGDDILSGRDGNDQLFGSDGDDTLFGGAGADQLDGGVDNDTVAYYDSSTGINVHLDNSQAATGGTATGDTYTSIENIIGSGHDDVITGDRFNNQINGSHGDDTIDGGAGADILLGAAGNDLIQGGAGQDTISGNNGADEIYAGTGDDVVYGGDESDVIYGNQGNDELYGGGGNDEIHGGADNDFIQGGLDAERLFGDGGEDEIRAGQGDDTALGGAGNDVIFGEDGDDILRGEAGDDYITGGAGDDQVFGDAGRDLLRGGIGNDHLEGGAGSDVISGGEGDDTLIGGGGSDFLIGDAGNDHLMGGEGTDFYVFEGDFGQDTISEAPDRQALDEVVFSEIGLEQLWFKEVGNDLVISVIGTTNTVTIVDYARFRINSDLSGSVLDQLNAAFDNMAPIDSLRVDTASLSIDKLNEMIDLMAGLEEPTSVDQVPQSIAAVRNTLWQEEELLALEARIDFAPVLNSQSFSLLEDTNFSGQLNAQDLNPDELLSYSVHTDPSKGVLTLDSATGDFTFTPNQDFAGAVTAIVEVTDSSGLTDKATLLFRVGAADDEGQIVSNIALSTSEDSPIDADLGFSDPDSIFGDYTASHNASLGTVEFHSDGSFTYTPFSNAEGQDDFTITLEDRSGVTYDSTVSVQVTGENDRPSTPALLNRSANEGGQIGGQIAVVDPDQGDTHTFSVVSAGQGTVNFLGNGQFTYDLAPDFAGEDRFTIRVMDDSGDALSFSDTEVVVQVANVNDAPTTQATLALSTSEGNTVSGDLALTDPDIPYGDTHTFTAAPNAGAIVFNNDGTFSYTPDSDANGIDNFTVTITDSAGAVASSDLSIIVTSVNDAPQVNGSLNLSTNEDNPIVGDLQLVDPDILSNGDTHTFSASPNLGTVEFNLDGTFTYTPTNELNGQDNFVVNVTDSAGSSVQSSVTVDIVPVNDAPQTRSTLAISILDNEQALGDLLLTDVDSEDLGNHQFSATPNTGSIVFNSDGTFVYTPDAGSVGLDTFTVTITDKVGTPESLTSTTNVTINVATSDVNDPPVLSVAATLLLAENSGVDASVGTATVTDADAGDGHTFTLLDDANGGFRIDANTGEIFANQDFDREAQTSYTIEIQVSDNGTPSLADSVIRTVQISNVNETPTAINTSGLFVNDDALLGTVVGIVTTTDPDVGDTFTYQLLDTNNNPVVADGRFRIDNQGQITTDTLAFDGDVNPTETIRVVATDAGGLSVTATLIVSVAAINDAPTGISWSEGTFTVVENDVGVQKVGRATAIDPDVNDSHEYFLVTGNDAGGRFSIDQNTGELFTTATANFDFENNQSHTIRVRVVDAQGGAREEFRTIEVTNIDEAPTNLSVTGALSIPEHSGANQVVGQASVTDPENQSITWDLGPSANGLFAIDSFGVITTASDFDFESQTSYDIQVLASDGVNTISTPPNSVTIQVSNVNEQPNSPAFTGPFALDENLAAGTVVGTVTASDPDGTTPGLTLANDHIGNFEIPGIFELVGNEIRTTQILNFENDGGSFNIFVRASDGTLFQNGSQTIVLNDVNETPSDIVLAQTLVVNENAGVNTIVGQLATIDQDTNETFTYDFDDTQLGDAGGRFTIDNNGFVRVALNANLNYETNTSHGITVLVTDSSLINTRTEHFTVALNNVDETPTGISWVSGTPSIAENAAPGTVVGRLNVSDPDTIAAFRDWNLSMTGNDANGRFTVDASNPNNIVVRVGATSLSVDQDSTHGVRVRATDANDPASFLDQDLNIVVTNLNGAPTGVDQPGILINEFSAWRPNVGGSTAGSESGDTVISNLNTLFSDPDGDPLSFHIQSGNVGNAFAIDNSTGRLFLNNADVLDYENHAPVGSNPSFALKVIAADQSLISNEIAININLADLEENQKVMTGASLFEGLGGHSSELVIHFGSNPFLPFSYVRFSLLSPSSQEVASGTIGLGINFLGAPHQAPFLSTGYDWLYTHLAPPIEGNEPILRFDGVSKDWNYFYYNGLAPIALDLDGDGLEWSTSILFDVDDDNELESTAWVGSDDGMLALDRNGNGIIDSGNEISFLNDLPGASTDLEGLAAFDTNSDGIFDASDAQFSEFLVWQDSNQDGVSDASELQTLAAAGISSIDLTPTPNTTPASVVGVELINTSTFTRSDGSTNTLGDVRFTYQEIDSNSPQYESLVSGTSAADTIIGELGKDNIDGLGGDDIIFSGESSDWVHGGDGNDLVAGEEGHDYLFGDAGNDEVQGAQGNDQIYGGDGDDQLFGGADHDTLFGEAGADTLLGGTGNDQLSGGTEVDILVGGLGQDTLMGDQGDDILSGSEGDDRLLGGSGNDSIDGGTGNNTVVFGFGDGVDLLADTGGTYVLELFASVDRVAFIELDSQLVVELLLADGTPSGDRVVVDNFNSTDLYDPIPGGSLTLSGIHFADGTQWDRTELINQLYAYLNPVITGTLGDDILDGTDGKELIEGLSGNDQINGLAGDDEIYGHTGNDQINAGDGDDQLYGGAGNDALDGEQGNDQLYGAAGNDTLLGDAGDDLLFGGDDDDQLSGGAGVDQLYGQTGNDSLSGGAGNDILDGGDGDDTLLGDAGDDQLIGGIGADNLDGGSEDDILDGGEGNDILAGGSGNDILGGGLGDDQAYGDAGNDLLVGGLGNDLLDGGADDDTLIGDRGQDTLLGGSGNDILTGGEGDDEFTGGLGDDIIDGGIGINTINFTRGDGVDTVVANDGQYQIALTNIATFEFSLSTISNAGVDSLVLDLGQGDQIIFEGVDYPAAVAADIIQSITFFDSNGTEIISVAGDVLDQPIVEPITIDLSGAIFGTSGDDLLSGTTGDDIFVGGLGNDTINSGLRGNDTYVFALGDGQDVINSLSLNETGPTNDIIYFQEGINPEDVIATHNNNNLILSIANSNDRVEVVGYFTPAGDRLIHNIVFADGTQWNVETVTAMMNVSTDGPDSITGFGGVDDVLSGGLGNDVLAGLGGNDTYIFNLGDGQDTIYNQDNDSSTVNDAIVFGAGIDANNILLSKTGDDLTIKIVGSTDRITVVDHFFTGNQNSVIHQLVFDDGNAWGHAEILSNLNVATEGVDLFSGFVDVSNTLHGLGGNDILKGANLSDHLFGDDGDDELWSFEGDDVLEGGLGSDTLDGGEGTNTIEFHLGDGADTVQNFYDVNNSYYQINLHGFDPDNFNLSAEIIGGIEYLNLNFNQNDVIRFKDFNFNSAITAGLIEQVTFFDSNGAEIISVSGDVLDQPIVEQPPSVIDLTGAILGTPGDDYTDGSNGDDVFALGQGDDFIVGHGGNDTYVFGLGDGQDFIANYDGNNDEPDSQDVIAFQPDIAVSDIAASHDGNDLVLTNINTGDEITVDRYFQSNGNYQINNITFADGTNWDVATVNSMMNITTAGDDTIYGFSGVDDVFTGGAGNDYLVGRSGNDTYVFGLGDGQDFIANYDGNNDEAGSQDVLAFQAGVATSDIVVSHDYNDLVLTNINTGDEVTVDRYFQSNGNYYINNITFADGTNWDVATVNSMMNIGTNGDDSIYGFGGVDDIITGGAGNDYLVGNGGNDTYVFGLGDGQDFIANYDGNNDEPDSQDVIAFQADIAVSDIAASHDGNDLVLTNINTGDEITVDRYFQSNGNYQINDITFADGTNWDVATVNSMMNIATAGDDSLYGFSGVDDVFMGGAGNDYLVGRSGNDTYVFGLGDGQDFIANYDGNNDEPDSQDVIAFQADIAVSDIAASHDGNDLVLTNINTGDEITVDRYFQSNGNYQINDITFADGTNWDVATVNSMMNIATAGDDALYGFYDTDDTLAGGAGNDFLYGNGGNDTYVFGLGDGQDAVNNYDDYNPNADNVDQLLIDNLSHDQLWLSRQGNDLQIDVVGTDDQITINNWYNSSQLYSLDDITTTSDNATLDFAEIDQLVNAMAQFDIPTGVGASIPQDQQDQLATVITSTWMS